MQINSEKKPPEKNGFLDFIYNNKYKPTRGDKMPVSEKKRKSLDAYNATCDYISIRPKKDKGEQIRQAAKLAGQSLQGYILQACAERMERDGLPIDQPAADEEK